MNTRERYLPLALRTVAFIATVAFYPLTVLWPSGWAWHTGSSEYLQMIIAIYATLGVFLWFAARRLACWASCVRRRSIRQRSAPPNLTHEHRLAQWRVRFAAVATFFVACYAFCSLRTRTLTARRVPCPSSPSPSIRSTPNRSPA